MMSNEIVDEKRLMFHERMCAWPGLFGIEGVYTMVRCLMCIIREIHSRVQ